LVEYNPKWQRRLEDMEQMQAEIEKIFHRPVDLITKKTIEASPNPYKRKNILDHTVVIYE
jgi:predicted nucleotidyltransferase